MKIYHGSYIQIQEPVISVSNHILDYGNGFYTTTDINQAVRFTEKFLRSGKNRILNYYEFDNDRAVKELLDQLPTIAFIPSLRLKNHEQYRTKKTCLAFIQTNMFNNGYGYGFLELK
ncbi:hypothetical protein FACS189485_16540 [Spirochaetia bacterium]|nr:hypothetical protein FACS189485_16540 [Spirochaetia bacterium]